MPERRAKQRSSGAARKEAAGSRSKLEPRSTSNEVKAPAGRAQRSRSAARDGDERKLAPRIAARIEADIIRRGWPVGEVLGSEAQLIEQFEVSRAVFREAVRIVESHHAANMRRGPNGGLVVTAPEISGVQASAALFLDYSGVKQQDLYEARAALELTCVRQVVERLDQEIIARLRTAIVEEEREIAGRGLTLHGGDIHQLIAELSGNSALWLFVEVLLRLMRQQSREKIPNNPSLAGDMHHAHVQIVEAIIAGEVGLAQHRMSRHLKASSELYH